MSSTDQLRLCVAGDAPDKPLFIEWHLLGVTVTSVIVPRDERDAQRVRNGVTLYPSRTTALDRAFLDGPAGSIWSNPDQTGGLVLYTEAGRERLIAGLVAFAAERPAKRQRRRAA